MQGKGRQPGFRALIAARTSSETFKNFVRGEGATAISPLLRPGAIQRGGGGGGRGEAARRARRGRHRSRTMFGLVSSSMLSVYLGNSFFFFFFFVLYNKYRQGQKKLGAKRLAWCAFNICMICTYIILRSPHTTHVHMSIRVHMYIRWEGDM